MRIIFAGDLDNTLLHSYKHKRDGDICIEYKNQVEQGFVTPFVYKNIPLLAEKYIFVPVTSRSIELYVRLDFFKDYAKYAITSGGGKLLVNMKEDEKWNEQTNAAVKNHQEEFNRLKSIFSHDPSFKRAKMIDNSFYFLLANDDFDIKSKYKEYGELTT